MDPVSLDPVTKWLLVEVIPVYQWILVDLFNLGVFAGIVLPGAKLLVWINQKRIEDCSRDLRGSEIERCHRCYGILLVVVVVIVVGLLLAAGRVLIIRP